MDSFTMAINLTSQLITGKPVKSCKRPTMICRIIFALLKPRRQQFKITFGQDSCEIWKNMYIYAIYISITRDGYEARRGEVRRVEREASESNT